MQKRTKQLLVATLATLCLSTAQAQSNHNESQSAFQREFASLNKESMQKSIFATEGSSSNNYNEQKYRRFKKMRTAGIVLTSVGAGLIIGGTALIIDGNNENDGYNFGGNCYDVDGLTNGDGKIIAGALGIVFGALSTGGGITMWAIGSNKMKKYGGGQMSLQPTRNGLGLAYRF